MTKTKIKELKKVSSALRVIENRNSPKAITKLAQPATKLAIRYKTNRIKTRRHAEHLARNIQDRIRHEGVAVFREGDLVEMARLHENYLHALPNVIASASKILWGNNVPNTRLNSLGEQLTAEKACKLISAADAHPYVFCNGYTMKGLFACNHLNKARDGALITAAEQRNSLKINGGGVAVKERLSIALDNNIFHANRQLEGAAILSSMAETAINNFTSFVKTVDNDALDRVKQLVGPVKTRLMLPESVDAILTPKAA